MGGWIGTFHLWNPVIFHSMNSMKDIILNEIFQAHKDTWLRETKQNKTEKADHRQGESRMEFVWGWEAAGEEGTEVDRMRAPQMRFDRINFGVQQHPKVAFTFCKELEEKRQLWFPSAWTQASKQGQEDWCLTALHEDKCDCSSQCISGPTLLWSFSWISQVGSMCYAASAFRDVSH